MGIQMSVKLGVMHKYRDNYTHKVVKEDWDGIYAVTSVEDINLENINVIINSLRNNKNLELHIRFSVDCSEKSNAITSDFGKNSIDK